jgi:hypothetical protein
MNSYEHIWELQIDLGHRKRFYYNTGLILKKEAKYCALGHFCDLKLGKKIARNTAR